MRFTAFAPLKNGAHHFLDAGDTIILKLTWYQPGTVGQLMEVFQVRGLE